MPEAIKPEAEAPDNKEQITELREYIDAKLGNLKNKVGEKPEKSHTEVLNMVKEGSEKIQTWSSSKLLMLENLFPQSMEALFVDNGKIDFKGNYVADSTIGLGDILGDNAEYVEVRNGDKTRFGVRSLITTKDGMERWGYKNIEDGNYIEIHTGYNFQIKKKLETQFVPEKENENNAHVKVDWIQRVQEDAKAEEQQLKEIYGDTEFQVNGDERWLDRSITRTDRHNNPTALKAYPQFIIALNQAGFQYGRDFWQGDSTRGIDSDSTPTIAFKNKETGIQANIALIDKIGFYTNSGQPRWDHTDMSEEDWVASDKRNVIMGMYQKEGGKNAFAQMSLKKKEVIV